MGILVKGDYTGRIDRAKDPVTWAIVLSQYIDLCAASGRCARAGNRDGAVYLGQQAKAIFARLW